MKMGLHNFEETGVGAPEERLTVLGVNPSTLRSD